MTACKRPSDDTVETSGPVHFGRATANGRYTTPIKVIGLTNSIALSHTESVSPAVTDQPKKNHVLLLFCFTMTAVTIILVEVRNSGLGQDLMVCVAVHSIHHETYESMRINYKRFTQLLYFSHTRGNPDTIAAGNIDFYIVCLRADMTQFFFE